ncbi:Uncharacterised protein [Mycobacterium tuberculosis]|nr:Uncharacterised protein [Mycobacterium tuberculosis]
MGRAVDHRRQRVRPGSTPRQSGRRSGSGGRTLLRRRCRYAPGRGPPRPGRGAGVARPGGRSGRVPGTRGGRRHAGLSRLPGPRRGPGREGDRCLGGRGPPSARRRTRRAPRRIAQRSVRLAYQPAGDGVLLERTGPRHRAAAGGNGNHAGSGGPCVTGVRQRPAARGPGQTARSRF